MHVVSIVQQKGGAGKTTLAVNLAGELRARGRHVIVIDADPQASAIAWAAPRKLGFEVCPEPLNGQTVAHWLRAVLKQRADLVIVDTPAGLGTAFRAAVDAADLIVVPCGPSSLELHAARQTVGEIRKALRSDARSRARVAIVPTRVDPQHPEGQQLVEELAALGATVGPPLGQDIYFVRAFSQGVAVAAAAPASPAAAAMRAVTDFLLDELSQRP